MGDTPDDANHLKAASKLTERDGAPERPLSERFLDLFVFLPTGLVVTMAEELPRMAERGRERLGVQVNSARAVGQFAVKAGTSELLKRSEGLKRPGNAPAGGPTGPSVTTRRTGWRRPHPAMRRRQHHHRHSLVRSMLTSPTWRRWPYPASTHCRPPKSSSALMG